jgi:DNA-directed RNA polymerase specialized sigma24 family protein
MEHTYGIGQDCEYVARRRRCAILRDLTEPDRVLLEWRMVDGWDYATIALRLGVPRADLVKRVHRIRTDLRRKAKTL